MQTPVYGAGGGQDASGYVNNQAVMPNNAIHFPPGTHSQPSTPTIGTITYVFVFLNLKDYHMTFCS